MLSKGGRRRRADGGLFKREDSQVWHAWYRDRKGEIRRESTGTTDQAQAERFLRDRLDARDDGRLATVLGSKQLTFNEWADWFLERRSRPPFRTAGTHQQNTNAMKFLRPVFGNQALGEITAEAIEDYLAQRLECGRRVHTKFGIEERGKVKPATVHQEFRILSHMLNVAVKQKRLSDNPCRAVEFPVSVAKSTRKPHYMTASEQARIEFAAPGYLRNIVVILSEMGLRPKKELLPMKKEQVDLENEVIHIADSKTVNGIGDMPMTPPAREAFARQMAEAEGSEYLFPTPKLKAKKGFLQLFYRPFYWEKTVHGLDHGQPDAPSVHSVRELKQHATTLSTHHQTLVRRSRLPANGGMPEPAVRRQRRIAAVRRLLLPRFR